MISQTVTSVVRAVRTARLVVVTKRAMRSFLSVSEIERSRVLQLVFGATLLSYFASFSVWIRSSSLTVDAVREGAYICRPYFQNCAEWYFLRALPEGYSQSLFYMVLFGTLVLSAYWALRGRWAHALVAALPAFLWHFTAVFVLTDLLGGNYDSYLFVLALILLFLPHKEFFLKLTLVLFYFLSTTTKIHDTWALGTYFSSLQLGLPLIPESFIPLATNLVIGMEMVGAWFLFSSRPYIRRSVLAFFVLFHLYSGILVSYRYPATVLPTLLILFGPLYKPTPAPLDYRSLAGWVLVACMFIVQFIPQAIPGDEKLTLEGMKYGLYMFDANHQCVSSARIYYGDGTTRRIRNESDNSRYRCDPYQRWWIIKQQCDMDLEIQRIEWTFDHSINGGPFVRIVNVPDACTLKYNPLSRNPWIKTELEGLEIVGFPVRNTYDRW